jgi:hypothetical protein
LPLDITGTLVPLFDIVNLMALQDLALKSVPRMRGDEPIPKSKIEAATQTIFKNLKISHHLAISSLRGV